MRFLEFGNPENEKMILIHGFQCPWQIWTEYIEVAGKEEFKCSGSSVYGKGAL